MKNLLKITLLSFGLIFALGFAVLAQDIELPDPGLTPDSPFYFFDTLWEKINLVFTFNPEKKIEKSLRFAEEKIAEVKVMADENKGEALEKASERYQEYLGTANQGLEELKTKGKDGEGLVSLVTGNILQHQDALLNVYKKTPEQVKDKIAMVAEGSQKGFEEMIKTVGDKGEESCCSAGLEEAEETKTKKIEEKRYGGSGYKGVILGEGLGYDDPGTHFAFLDINAKPSYLCCKERLLGIFKSCANYPLDKMGPFIRSGLEITLVRKGVSVVAIGGDVPMEDIIEEQKRQQSPLYDPKTRVKMGKLINPDYVIEGEFTFECCEGTKQIRVTYILYIRDAYTGKIEEVLEGKTDCFGPGANYFLEIDKMIDKAGKGLIDFAEITVPALTSAPKPKLEADKEQIAAPEVPKTETPKISVPAPAKTPAPIYEEEKMEEEPVCGNNKLEFMETCDGDKFSQPCLDSLEDYKKVYNNPNLTLRCFNNCRGCEINSVRE